MVFEAVIRLGQLLVRRLSLCRLVDSSSLAI